MQRADRQEPENPAARGGDEVARELGGDELRRGRVAREQMAASAVRGLQVWETGDFHHDGIADDGAYLLGAGGAGGPIMLTHGKTYRVSSNRTIGTVWAAGGVISVDAGVTLTVKGVVGPAASVIFSGLGIVETKTRTYSVAWFAGASLNEKWDMCRRSFLADQHYTCHWPRPDKTDAAAVLATGAEGARGYMWRVTAPVVFDDPENNGTIISDAKLCVTAACDAALLFSTANKTEEINFPVGLWVEGRYNCNYGNCILDRFYGIPSYGL